MSNPFLVAKRLGPPKQHAAFRKTKYPEIWKMDVDALKHLYSITDDKYKKCAITRAINEKLGIKIIRPTEKQEIARKLNYLTFITAGYNKQLLIGMHGLDLHLPELPEMLRTDRDSQLFTVMAKLKVIQQHIEQLMLYIEQINQRETGPRKRPSKRGTAWKQADNTGHNHDNQKS